MSELKHSLAFTAEGRARIRQHNKSSPLPSLKPPSKIVSKPELDYFWKGNYFLITFYQPLGSQAPGRSWTVRCRKGERRKMFIQQLQPSWKEETINLFLWELQSAFQRLCFFWCISDKPPNPDRMLTCPCCTAQERRRELSIGSASQRSEHTEGRLSPLSRSLPHLEVGWERVWSFSPTWTTNQYRPRGHPTRKVLLTTRELPSAIAGVVQKGTGVHSPCQELPDSPQPDQVVHFQTLPHLKASLLVANTLQERRLQFFPLWLCLVWVCLQPCTSPGQFSTSSCTAHEPPTYRHPRWGWTTVCAGCRFCSPMLHLPVAYFPRQGILLLMGLST